MERQGQSGEQKVKSDFFSLLYRLAEPWWELLEL